MKQKSSSIIKKILLPALTTGFLLMAMPAYAATPALSVSQNGNTVTLTVNNADANSSVSLYQKQSASTWTITNNLGNTDSSGNFTASQTINFDGSSNPVQLYVMVDNLSSPTVQIPPGTCSSSCVTGSLSLSQTSVNINSAQAVTVVAYPTAGSIYVSGNTNTSAANYMISGNQIIITGQNTGVTTITVCSSASQCSGILVTVNGGTGTGLNFSNTNPVLILSQSQTVTIYSPSSNSGSYTISSNSNSNVVTASISGSTLFLYGQTIGNSSLSICQSGTTFCGTVSVTVGVASGSSSAMSLSSSALTMTTGQTNTVTVSNSQGSLYISNNSNSAVISAGVSNQTITVYAVAAGSATLTICQNNYSGCLYLYVVVGGSSNSNNSGSISFSNSNPVLTVGQNQSLAIYSTNISSPTYTISSNSNPNVASLSLSGSTIYLVGQTIGTSNISICQTSSTVCATLAVTVNGQNGGLTFSPNTVTLAQNQSSTITISGGSGTYYLSSNTNPSAAAVSLQSNSLLVTGLNSGTTSLTVCQSGNAAICGTIVVTVGNSTVGTTTLSFSNSSPTLTVGQSLSLTISGGSGSGSYYISSIGNSAIAAVNISGSQLNITGSSTGTSLLTVCQTGGSICGSLTVSVGLTSTTGTPLFLSNTGLSSMVVGQNFSYQLTATGGSGNTTYTVTSGTLPAGVSMTNTGSVTGTPTVSGSYIFTITATDSSGSTSAANFSINVTPAGSISTPTPPTGSPSTSTSYPNGELILENGTIYIVYLHTKVGFANANAFLGLGFKFSNVTTTANSGLTVSPKVVVTASGAHPRGTWIISGQAVYFVTPSGLIPVSDWNTFLANGGQVGFLVKANSNDLAFKKLAQMTANDSRLQP